MTEKIGKQQHFKTMCIRCKNVINPYAQCKCLEDDVNFLLREFGLLKTRVKWLEHLAGGSK